MCPVSLLDLMKDLNFAAMRCSMEVWLPRCCRFASWVSITQLTPWSEQHALLCFYLSLGKGTQLEIEGDLVPFVFNVSVLFRRSKTIACHFLEG